MERRISEIVSVGMMMIGNCNYIFLLFYSITSLSYKVINVVPEITNSSMASIDPSVDNCSNNSWFRVPGQKTSQKEEMPKTTTITKKHEINRNSELLKVIIGYHVGTWNLSFRQKKSFRANEVCQYSDVNFQYNVEHSKLN